MKILTLKIESQTDTQMRFSLMSLDPVVRISKSSTVHQLTDSVPNIISSFAGPLCDAMTSADQSRLGRVGKLISQNLYPDDVLRVLAETDATTLILDIESSLAGLPWQFGLLNESEIICRKFIVARNIRSENLKSYSEREIGDRFLVVGDPDGSLPEASAEAIFLKDALATFGKLSLVVGSIYQEEFLSAIDQADFLHYAGHSSINGIHLSDGVVVAPSVIRGLARVPFFVFLNSCEADSPEGWRGPASNVVRAFLEAGSHVVIAPRIPVQSRHAKAFAQEIYLNILEKGLPVGEAFRLASMSMGKNTLIAEAFSIYGNPLLKFDTETSFANGIIGTQKRGHSGALQRIPFRWQVAAAIVLVSICGLFVKQEFFSMGASAKIWRGSRVLDATNLRSLLRSAKTNLSEGQMDQAGKALREAVGLAPEIVEVWTLVATMPQDFQVEVLQGAVLDKIRLNIVRAFIAKKPQEIDSLIKNLPKADIAIYGFSQGLVWDVLLRVDPHKTLSRAEIFTRASDALLAPNAKEWAQVSFLDGTSFIQEVRTIMLEKFGEPKIAEILANPVKGLFSKGYAASCVADSYDVDMIVQVAELIEGTASIKLAPLEDGVLSSHSKDFTWSIDGGKQRNASFGDRLDVTRAILCDGYSGSVITGSVCTITMHLERDRILPGPYRVEVSYVDLDGRQVVRSKVVHYLETNIATVSDPTSDFGYGISSNVFKIEGDLNPASPPFGWAPVVTKFPLRPKFVLAVRSSYANLDRAKGRKMEVFYDVDSQLNPKLANPLYKSSPDESRAYHYDILKQGSFTTLNEDAVSLCFYLLIPALKNGNHELCMVSRISGVSRDATECAEFEISDDTPSFMVP